ncbi:MAG: preprotein translocase subunit SecA [Dehalococcoidia bacterium]|nr:preprotein translocase subunit SecA [Dehalococcoidia bacterium]
MVGFFRKILGGDSNERVVKQMQPLVARINAHADEVAALDDAALTAKTHDFRDRLEAGATLDDLLPEVFAVAREAIARTTGERAYDVQLLGAITLHRGQIAEMRTGEGKTLVATITIYLNALAREGVHSVTVNDYLARRDAQWYAPALDLLGITIGVIQNLGGAFRYSSEVASDQSTYEHLVPVSRLEAYQADVTYGTNNEFGFDYLRDNMATTVEGRVQSTRHFAIVDEADSVLIDEARTPLIISGATADDTSVYKRFVGLVPLLADGRDYKVDLKTRSVTLTEAGVEALERGLGIDNIYSLENFRLTRYMEAALKAQIVYQRDRDYVVKDGEVIIVDDFTGRLMEGRRWSDGLHQAVEAKEGVTIQQESVTYATITIQNFFRLYKKLAGMTGTAMTEAEELAEIYKLEVVSIPTHRPVHREDSPDLVFKTEKGKWDAVVEDIVTRHESGRPVLVGTVAIETSEMLSELLTRRGVAHEVLNAKQHAREAQIIARAGQRSEVTIATNMAGRGTDIKLGEGVAALGGLHVIGTERHEARRIDHQLRGRTGRQGDPGSTRFFVSFEDELMRRFAPDWLPGMMSRLGMADDMPLESNMVTRAIEQAQQRVESYNFDTRKHVVEYDDVMNTHRDVIYRERDKVLAGEGMRDTVMTMLEDEVESLSRQHLEQPPAELEAFRVAIEAIAPLPPDAFTDPALTPAEAVDEAIAIIDEAYQALEAEVGEEMQRIVERLVVLHTIDLLWVEHLTAMDEMRQGIGLRAYGQSDPLVAYKREARDMWEQFLERLREQVSRQVLHARLTWQAAEQAMAAQPPPRALRESGPDVDGGDEPVMTTVSNSGAGVTRTATATRARPAAAGRAVAKVGRNDACPCGSGKKYKRCHGA